MIREKSVGIIVFRHHPEEGLQYLVMYHRGSYWNFPKGKVEAGESEMETALRETQEEAGLANLKIIDGWRQQTQFFFKEKRSTGDELIKKDFILYLAEVPMGIEPQISHEHNGYAWLDSKTAAKYLKFKNLKEILVEADSYVNNKIKEYQAGRGRAGSANKKYYGRKTNR